MRVRHSLYGFVAGCATMGLAAAAFLPAQDPPDMEAMQKMWEEAMAKYVAPSAEHEMLSKREGRWDVTVKYWYAPEGPPQVSTGGSSYKMILDGHYLLQEFEGDFEGETFNGAGVMGYDRMKEKFVSVWIDNMSTAVMVSEGTAKGSAIELHGEMPDVMQGKYVKSRTVEKMLDDNTLLMEMYTPGPDGNMFRSLEVTYKRVVE